MIRGVFMAFFLCTKGHLHLHDFDYLSKEHLTHRLEKTKVKGKPTGEVNEVDDHEVLALDLMTRHPLTVELTTTLDNVKKIFEEKTISHLPVLKDSTFVIGMISDRDILKIQSLSTFSFLKAQDIMNTILILADEETPVAQLAKVMVQERISCIPIINNKNQFTGILTKTDILKGVFEFRMRTI